MGGSLTLDVPESGEYTVELLTLPDHCFSDAGPAVMSVSDGAQATTAFDVGCVGGFAHVHNNNELVYRDIAGNATEFQYLSRLFLFDWESTGRYLLFRENDDPGCPLSILDGQNGTVTAVPGSSAGYAGPEPAWSPSGTRFAVLRTGSCSSNAVGDAILVIDAASGSVVDSIGGLIDAPSVTWGPTPDRVVYAHGLEIRWRDWSTGEDSLLVALAEAPQSLAWSPQEDLLAATVASGGDTFLRVYDASGTEVAMVGGAGSRFERPRWSPDGMLLAIGTHGGGGTTVVDRAGNEVFSLVQRNGGFAAFPNWAPDSGSLLFTGNDGSRNYVGWVDASGQDRRTLTDDVGDDDEARFAGSGDNYLYHTVVGGGLALYIATVDGQVRAEISQLSRSGFPRWRPNISLNLN